MSVMYLFSIPVMKGALNQGLETDSPVTVDEVKRWHPDVVVVLAGGVSRSPEYPLDSVHLRTLGRLRYGAYWAKMLNIPIVVSGGFALPEGAKEADLMARTLRQDYGIERVIVENDSATTWENAMRTTGLLCPMKKDRVLLVTHASHMPRAVKSFRQMGISVLPAPTLFFSSGINWWDWHSWVPSASAVYGVWYGLHEWLGRFWYWLRYHDVRQDC